jgi:hypothetical protein
MTFSIMDGNSHLVPAIVSAIVLATVSAILAIRFPRFCTCLPLGKDI